MSADMRDLMRTGSMPKKTSEAKGALTVEHRLAIWHGVCSKYDKADWGKIEEATGMTTTKLKRHFRDVLIKDGEKAIKGK